MVGNAAVTLKRYSLRRYHLIQPNNSKYLINKGVIDTLEVEKWQILSLSTCPVSHML